MAQSKVAFFEQESHSFVIRLWREEDGSLQATHEWRGWVEHVQSQQRYHFRGQRNLYEIMSTYLGDAPDLNQILTAVANQKQDAD
jgi:hypothetical protein